MGLFAPTIRKVDMRVFSMALVSLVLLSSAQGQQINCDNPVTTYAMASCAERELKLAEAEMKATYDRALAAFVPTDSELKEGSHAYPSDRHFYERVRRNLRTSQDSWLRYRQSFCATVDETYDGGTGASIAVPNCKLELTVQRTKNLNDWLGQWFRKDSH